MLNKTINGYTIKRKLGEGGMAEVWYAENGIGKPAAVKLLKYKFCADETVVERFQNEAKVMVKLNHPNIRQVYDYALFEGRPCIIMEYLEGQDLKTLVKKHGAFDSDTAANYWSQIVAALNYTHGKGVVHRDIKPSNIFVTDEGQIKLLDFGIAKVRDAVTGTQTGQKLGTLVYMSPEQIMDSKHVDYRTDIYSLAVTFVHLLTGRVPYDTDSSSDFEIMKQIVESPLDMTGVPVEWQEFLHPYQEKEFGKRMVLKPFTKFGHQKLEETIITNTSDVDDHAEETMLEGMADREDVSSQKVFNLRFGKSLDLMIGDIPLLMIFVEGGTYNMGKNDNGVISNFLSGITVHPVKVSNFYISESVVTQALWKAVMGNNPSHFKGDNRPVEMVSWWDCMKFIEKLNSLTGRNFRLPAEAEWEYAARGGSKSMDYKFAGGNSIDDVAWYENNSCDKTHLVKKLKPNELGLYDMSGNVWEWCMDENRASSRVIRGGCFFNNAKYCQVAYRHHHDGSLGSYFIGFRLYMPL